MPTTGESGHVEVEVDAPAGDVLAVVRDVTRMPDLSPEIVRVRWVSEARGRGARFRGWSRAGPVVWVRTCEVVVDDPVTFAFVTRPAWWNHDATVWRFVVVPLGPDRCRLVQRYEVLRGAPWFIRLGGKVSGRTRRLPDHRRTTVERVAVAAQTRPRAAPRD